MQMVVLDINLEEAELKMLNLGKQQFVFLDTSIKDNLVLIEPSLVPAATSRKPLCELACRYTGRLLAGISTRRHPLHLKHWLRSW